MFTGFTEQELVNDFKLHFPLVAKHAVKYRLKKYGLLEVILDDNSKLVFDYVNKSIFNIKDNLDDISETDWRKHFRYKLIMILMPLLIIATNYITCQAYHTMTTTSVLWIIIYFSYIESETNINSKKIE